MSEVPSQKDAVILKFPGTREINLMPGTLLERFSRLSGDNTRTLLFLLETYYQKWLDKNASPEEATGHIEDILNFYEENEKLPSYIDDQIALEPLVNAEGVIDSDEKALLEIPFVFAADFSEALSESTGGDFSQITTFEKSSALDVLLGLDIYDSFMSPLHDALREPLKTALIENKTTELLRLAYITGRAKDYNIRFAMELTSNLIRYLMLHKKYDRHDIYWQSLASHFENIFRLNEPTSESNQP